MSVLQIPVAQIEMRSRKVSKLLLPLRPSKIPVGCKTCPQPFRGCKVIAAHDGTKSVESFGDWYFKTFAPDIVCQYYELWQPFRNDSKLHLFRAYLNLSLVNRSDYKFEKLLSIHCDPCEDNSNAIGRYKRGPHLHVQKAEYPIPECHFPLNFTELDRVLSSVDSVTEALANAIEIVRTEVLLRYK
jgi:hypothetical protein